MRWRIAILCALGPGACLGTWCAVRVWRARAPAALAAAPRWAEGVSYTYNLVYRSTGEAALPAPTAGDPGTHDLRKVDTSLRASLVQTLWRRHSCGVDLQVRLEPAGSGGVIVCLAHMGEGGKLLDLRFAADVDMPDRQLARAVLAATQVDTTGVGGPAPWSTTERDLSGCWPVAYAPDPQSAPTGTFTKSPGGGQTEAGLDVRRRGSLHGALALPEGHILRLAGTVDSEFWSGTHRLGSEHMEVSMQLLRAGPTPPGALASAAALAATDQGGASSSSPLGAEEAFGQLRRAALCRTLGGATPQSLAERYMRAQDGDRETLHALSAQLEAMLELDPGAAADAAVDLLAALAPHANAFSSVAASLGYVGHAAAQGALRRAVAASGGSPAAVRQLIAHLAMVEHPEDESADVLEELAATATDRGIETSARLGLGIMGHALRVRDPARADAIFADAAANLARSRDAMLNLRVLGNLGDPRQVALVDKVMATGEDDLRIAALYSLRFVATNAARRRLLEAVTHDRSAAARGCATEALGFYPATAELVEAYTQQLATERSVPVLRELLRNLGRATAAHPKAARAMDAFIAHCGHPEVCALAASLRQVAG